MAILALLPCSSQDSSHDGTLARQEESVADFLWAYSTDYQAPWLTEDYNLPNL